MPTTISDVMSTLHDLLLDHFQSINSGTASQPFLAFELGTPIPDALFRNPADTTQYSAALALEYLSHRSNCVPAIEQQLFVETGKTVDGLYEILLRGSTPVDSANMELLGAIKNTAQSAFDGVIRAESAISEQYRPTHGDPVDWYDQSVAGNWTAIHISRSDQPVRQTLRPVLYNARLMQWDVAQPEVRADLGNPESTVLRAAIESRRLAAIRPIPQAHLAPMSFQQAAVSSAGMTLAPLATAQMATSIHSRFQPGVKRVDERSAGIGAVIGAGARVHDDAPIPRVTVPPPAPPPQPVSSDAFSISVDISIVKLRRPWLSDSLLNLGGWYVPSSAKGSFSGGTGADDVGILPVMPVACVLIRNLAIQAQWSGDDQKNLENSTHLGVFGLQGRSYDRNSATLTVPGMQSVAWICDPLPVLPPCDAPAS